MAFIYTFPTFFRMDLKMATAGRKKKITRTTLVAYNETGRSEEMCWKWDIKIGNECGEANKNERPYNKMQMRVKLNA